MIHSEISFCHCEDAPRPTASCMAHIFPVLLPRVEKFGLHFHAQNDVYINVKITSGLCQRISCILPENKSCINCSLLRVLEHLIQRELQQILMERKIDNHSK